MITLLLNRQTPNGKGVKLNVLFNNIDLAKQFNQHEYEEACIIISDPQ